MIAAANYRDQMRAHFLARSAHEPRRARHPDPAAARQHQAAVAARSRSPTSPTSSCSRSAAAPRRSQVAIGFSSSAGQGPRRRHRHVRLQRPDHDRGRQDQHQLRQRQRRRGRRSRARSTRWCSSRRTTRCSKKPTPRAGAAIARRRSPRSIDYIDTEHDAARAIAARPRTTATRACEDRYNAKNNYIDTVGELKLVRGVDDRFWTLFGNAFTVYGGCKINLSALVEHAADRRDPLPRGEEPERSGAASNPQRAVPARRATSRRRGSSARCSRALDDFIDFVKDPGAAVVDRSPAQERHDGRQRGGDRDRAAGMPGLPAARRSASSSTRPSSAQIATSRSAPHLPRRGVGRDRAQAEEQGRLAGVPADPLDDHRRVGHQGRPAERRGSRPCRTARGCS